jgi:nucleoside-diphosphate-sugar epimerase
MSSLLVTGATGFIGRAALPLLVAAGYTVEAVRHVGPAPEVPGVRWHRCDLFDPAESEQLVAGLAPPMLLHLAWNAVPGEFWTSADNVRWVEASLRLVRSFAANGGKRAVLVGSCAEYDPAAGVCSERTSPLRPETLYGACKIALQEVVAAHSTQVGYSAAWARIFHPFGAGERADRLIPTVIRGLLAGRPVDLTEGHQQRDFLAVEEVASAIVRLLASTLEGPLNIGSGRATSVREIVSMIVANTGGSELVRFGARPGGEGPPLVVADTARLGRELGWSPSAQLEVGVAAAVDWWRQAS